MSEQPISMGGYSLLEAVTGQGGIRAILMVEDATGVTVESFSNGYDNPSAETRAEAKGFLRGWVERNAIEALVMELLP